MPGVTLGIPVAGGEKKRIAVSCEAYEAKLFEGEATGREILCPAILYVPIEAGERIGSVRFSLGEEILAELPLCAEESYQADQSKINLSFFDRIQKFFWT